MIGIARRCEITAVAGETFAAGVGIAIAMTTNARKSRVGAG